MLNHNIEVGDYVKLYNSPQVIEGTVVEINSEEETIKVVFEFYETEMRNFTTDDGEFDWFSQYDVLDIRREYKILNISQHNDTVTAKMKTWFEMARVNNNYSQSVNGYYYNYTDYDTTIFDTFVFLGLAKDIRLAQNPEENKHIYLSNFTINDFLVDGVLRKGYQSIKL